MKYRIQQDSTGLWLETESPEGCLLGKDRLYYYGDSLLLISYKWWLNTRYLHIDEVELFRRKEPRGNSYQVPAPEEYAYYIPDGMQGNFYVAYNQPDGEPVVYDEQNRLKLVIPSSRILYTQAQLNPETFAFGKQQFFYVTDEKNDLQEIPYLSNHKRCDQTLYYRSKIAPDSVFVEAMGYNQLARNYLEDSVGRKVYGDVERIGIVPFKELRRRLQLPWSSVWKF